MNWLESNDIDCTFVKDRIDIYPALRFDQVGTQQETSTRKRYHIGNMDVDAPAASSSSTPLSFLEHQEAAASSELKPLWTRIRSSYEKK